MRDYFRDLENFLRQQYFSSVSLRIRKHVRLTSQTKKLETEISVLNDECAKLEEQVASDKELIQNTKLNHQKNVQVNKNFDYKNKYFETHFIYLNKY